jgi:hypothetical protein
MDFYDLIKKPTNKIDNPDVVDKKLKFIFYHFNTRVLNDGVSI